MAVAQQLTQMRIGLPRIGFEHADVGQQQRRSQPLIGPCMYFVVQGLALGVDKLSWLKRMTHAGALDQCLAVGANSFAH